MSKEIRFGIGGLAIGLLLGILVAQNAVNNNQSGMMRMMGMRFQNDNALTSTMDAHFIEQMVPHHEDAITMAKLALEKAKRGEIKTLAQNIIDSQSREINQMKEWYKSWFGKLKISNGRGC